jgi:hypothetical protein
VVRVRVQCGRTGGGIVVRWNDLGLAEVVSVANQLQDDVAVVRKFVSKRRSICPSLTQNVETKRETPHTRTYLMLTQSYRPEWWRPSITRFKSWGHTTHQQKRQNEKAGGECESASQPRPGLRGGEWVGGWPYA